MIWGTVRGGGGGALGAGAAQGQRGCEAGCRGPPGLRLSRHALHVNCNSCFFCSFNNVCFPGREAVMNSSDGEHSSQAGRGSIPAAGALRAGASQLTTQSLGGFRLRLEDLEITNTGIWGPPHHHHLGHQSAPAACAPRDSPSLRAGVARHGLEASHPWAGAMQSKQAGCAHGKQRRPRRKSPSGRRGRAAPSTCATGAARDGRALGNENRRRGVGSPPGRLFTCQRHGSSPRGRWALKRV